MLKRVGAAMAAVLLAAPPLARGQAVTYDETQALFYARNISAAAYEYCSLEGMTLTALGPSRVVNIPIETSGSSVATVASTAGTGPFLGLAVGDELTAQLNGLTTYRYVAAYTDVDTIEVDTAWDLGTTGVPFRWRNLVCGTAADDGLITSGRRAQRVVFDIQVLSIAATSIDVQIEGRNPGAGTGWTPVGTETYTATGGGAIVVNQLHYEQYRLGVKVTGDVGDQSVTAKVTVIG